MFPIDQGNESLLLAILCAPRSQTACHASVIDNINTLKKVEAAFGLYDTVILPVQDLLSQRFKGQQNR